jgi:hypothetical protein
MLLAASACTKAERGEQAELRDGFEHLCPAVTKAKSDPKAVRDGEVLLSASSELPRDWVAGPAFEQFMESLASLGPDERYARLSETIEALGLTSECADLLYYAGPGGANLDAAKISAAKEYPGEGFLIENVADRLYPWREGDYAGVWDRGGVALTPKWHQGDRQRSVLSIEAVDAELDACEEHARTYLASRSRQLADIGTTRWPHTYLDAFVDVCCFTAKSTPEHAGLSGALVKSRDKSLRILCEGDRRYLDQLNECQEDIVNMLKPAPGKSGFRADGYAVRMYSWN